MTQMVPVGSVDQVRVLVVTAHQLARKLEWKRKPSHSEYDLGLGPAAGCSTGLNKYHTVVHEAASHKGHRRRQEKSQDGVCGRATCHAAYRR